MKRQSKGSSLVLILFITAILAILGATVLSLWLSDTKLAVHDDNRMKAYYLARSGVDATSKWMLSASNRGSEIINKSVGDASIPNMEGKLDVSVSPRPSYTGQVVVKAVATVAGVSNSAAMVLYQKATSEDEQVFKHTLYGTTTVTVTGNSQIYGSVGTGGTLTLSGHYNITGSKDEHVVIHTPDVELPADPSSSTNIIDIKQITDNLIVSYSPDVLVYKQISMSSANTFLTFDTGSVPDQIMTVVVDSLNLSNGTVKITGAGKLRLYVKTTAVFDADVNVSETDPTKGGVATALAVYLYKGCNTTFDGNHIFSGFVYAPKSTVTITGSSQTFTGGIIADEVKCSGTPIADSNDIPTDGTTYGDLGISIFEKGSWLKQ